MYTKDIPAFGPLQGVRVVHATQSIAGPYTATRMADFGADVIWIETPKGMDVMQTFAQCVSEVGVIEKKPLFEGRSLTMVLGPKAEK